MKNREYKTLVAIATASALLVGSLGVVSPSLAQDDKTTMTQTVENTDQKKFLPKILPMQNHSNPRLYMQKLTETEMFLQSLFPIS